MAEETLYDSWEMPITAPHSFIAAMIRLRSKASASIAPKLIAWIRGATPTVSKRFPGSRIKRTRLPGAAVSASILVVQPPFDLPIA